MTSGRDLRGLVVVLVAAGLLVGLAWYLLAPTPAYRVEADGLYFASTQPSEFIAMDGWFGGLALLAGVVCGVLAVRRDRTGWSALVVLAVGGLAAAVLAWRFGHLLGPAPAAVPQHAVVGDVVHGPLDLEATGVLVLWPAASLVVVLLALGWRGPEADDRPARPAGSVGGEPLVREVDRGQG